MSGVSQPPTSKPSLTHKFRRYFPRSASGSVSSPTPTSNAIAGPTSTPPTLPSSSPLGGNYAPSPLSLRPLSQTLLVERILQRALGRLSADDQLTLRDYLPANRNDVGLAIEQTLQAAKAKQRECEEKRWRFEIAGRTIILKDVADKVVHWLSHFTKIGDVIANVDPVHVFHTLSCMLKDHNDESLWLTLVAQELLYSTWYQDQPSGSRYPRPILTPGDVGQKDYNLARTLVQESGPATESQKILLPPWSDVDTVLHMSDDDDDGFEVLSVGDESEAAPSVGAQRHQPRSRRERDRRSTD